MMLKMLVSWIWRGRQGADHHRLSSLFAAVLLLIAVGILFCRLSTNMMISETATLDSFNKDTSTENIKMIYPSKGPSKPPVLAYWIYGFKEDSKRMTRLLKAVYHPRNQYLLHLLDGDDKDRLKLAICIGSEHVFRAFGNVNVVGESYAVMESGASSLAAMLHASALLLRISHLWDWFFTLSSSDYPLFTQDDILFAFKSLPRDLNFARFTNTPSDQKGMHNYNRIVVDPALYLKQSDSLYYAVETREPTTFDTYEGSPWMALSRGFMEHCIKGWDNFPRKLLMYYANVVSPLESYFHTVLCNSPEFRRTIVNQDLWSSVPVNLSNYESLVQNLAIFARPFKESDPSLVELDKNILNQQKWFNNVGGNHSSTSNSTTWDDIDSLDPGFYGQKLQNFMSKFVAGKRHMITNLCNSTSHF